MVAEPMSRVGELENKAISASNLKLKLTEAELGNFHNSYVLFESKNNKSSTIQKFPQFSKISADNVRVSKPYSMPVYIILVCIALKRGFKNARIGFQSLAHDFSGLQTTSEQIWKKL